VNTLLTFNDFDGILVPSLRHKSCWVIEKLGYDKILEGKVQQIN